MIKALLTGAAAFSLAAAPVFADSVRTVSGSTAIKLNMDLLTPFLTNVNVKGTLTPLGTAKLSKTGILTLPILSGAVDLTDADGEIIHGGGFKISRYAVTDVSSNLKTVVFSNLALEVKVAEPGATPPIPATTIQITAVVSENGTVPFQPAFEVRPPATIPVPIPQHRIPLFNLTAAPSSLALNKAKKLVINGGTLALTEAATVVLNRGLGLPSANIPAPEPPAPSFTPGTTIGLTSLLQAATKKL